MSWLNKFTNPIKAIGEVISDNNTTVDEKLERVKQIQEEANDATTERTKIDMSSDSWLSKNIRPLVFLYLLISYTVFSILDSSGVFHMRQEFITILEELLKGVSLYYFVGRSGEKIMDIIKKRK
ncbi:hypothetical protein DF185_07860 [Marinifilum breve]|uniref:Holin n=1 Tax=Marinifilum breve TaxID=2184082 RepID=A0A2V4A234_9BACT|nr:hypothetical protein [Marinifilum breve]PXY01390.1 hypothetical protein DF185_07860 [Marinifilum breve]